MFGCWIQICSSDVTNGVAMTNKRIKRTLDFDVSGHRTWGESIGLWRRHRTLESYKSNLLFYCPILLFVPPSHPFSCFEYTQRNIQLLVLAFSVSLTGKFQRWCIISKMLNSVVLISNLYNMFIFLVSLMKYVLDIIVMHTS